MPGQKNTATTCLLSTLIMFLLPGKNLDTISVWKCKKGLHFKINVALKIQNVLEMSGHLRKNMGKLKECYIRFYVKVLK